jgi:NADPH-dependent 7-cyano-7-deazaguanine reductase QueF
MGRISHHGASYEDVTNRILDDLVAILRPRSMKITAAFTPAAESARTCTSSTARHAECSAPQAATIRR